MLHARLPRHVLLLLLLAFVGINLAAVFGILASRRDAESEAREELRLETAMHARSLEARLASLRADLGFLSQSPPLAALTEVLLAPDPLARRWGRLDIDASLLLFLDAHPEIEHLVVKDGAGHAVVAAARQDGAPALAPAERYQVSSAAPPDLLLGTWPIGHAARGGGKLEAMISARPLLAEIAPGLHSFLSLEDGAAPEPRSRGRNTVVVPVEEAAWSPPVKLRLVRLQGGSRLVASVAALAARYRTTVLLNLVVMSLALVLGGVALAQARRRAALEAAGREQATIRDLERQLLHSERLAAVGRLAAGMAHEVNNPLEGMSNYLALLEDDLGSGRTEGALALTGKVRAGLERVAAVVRQVLTFSSPERAAKEPLRLHPVLADAVGFVRANAAFRQVEIALAPETEPLCVHGNAVTLGQLFLNLVLNACQHQPGGGRVEVSLERDGGRAVVTVLDHGPGIAPEALARLFEPFYSTRGSTGLGLSVCYGIAQDHGGTIAAANLPGGGARFQVEIPLAASEIAAVAGAAVGRGAEA